MCVKTAENFVFDIVYTPFSCPQYISRLVLQTEIFDAVERVQVEDGWVSMRLREDNGTGVPLLKPLN